MRGIRFFKGECGKTLAGDRDHGESRIEANQVVVATFVQQAQHDRIRNPGQEFGFRQIETAATDQNLAGGRKFSSGLRGSNNLPDNRATTEVHHHSEPSKSKIRPNYK